MNYSFLGHEALFCARRYNCSATILVMEKRTLSKSQIIRLISWLRTAIGRQHIVFTNWSYCMKMRWNCQRTLIFFREELELLVEVGCTCWCFCASARLCTIWKMCVCARVGVSVATRKSKQITSANKSLNSEYVCKLSCAISRWTEISRSCML